MKNGQWSIKLLRHLTNDVQNCFAFGCQDIEHIGHNQSNQKNLGNSACHLCISHNFLVSISHEGDKQCNYKTRQRHNSQCFKREFKVGYNIGKIKQEKPYS